MKIKRITIKNFRQFWQEQKINFACSSEKNVTVIHGANGSGKTSLLNAFKWCFYGETDFDTGNEFILNESAIQESKTGQIIELYVSVNFEQEDCDYNVTRTAKYRKLPGDKIEDLKLIEFKIQKIIATGETIAVDTPISEINKVLPQGLHPYFFFNGERIEKIASVNESGQVKDAIKSLMGLKQIERAERHLKRAFEKFRKINAETSDKDHQVLTENVAKLSIELEDKNNLLSECNSKLLEKNKRKEDIEGKLESFKESKFLQEQRSILNRANDKLVDDLAENSRLRKELIDTNRAVILSHGIVHKCEALVDLNRKKGLLPYKVRAPFIDDLIQQNKCICGRSIHDDSNALTLLEEARENAGTDSLDEVYSSISFLIKNQEKSFMEYERTLQELIQKNEKIKREKESNENEISEIGLKIGTLKNTEIEFLEVSLNKLNDEISELEFNIRSLNGEIPLLRAEFDKSDKDLIKLEKKQKQHSLVVKRITAAKNVANAFAELNACFTDQVRRSLSERVDATFRKIIRKNVRAYIDDEFHLRIEKHLKSGEVEAKEQSTGEKQVTSLSFISSIISLAKEKHEQKGKFFKGGLYPLVMDSPFGALDDDYRFKVAESVANLADQVIIFVSNSQWNGNVKKACGNRVGSSYRLIHHATTDVAKTIENNEYLTYSKDGFEYSTLEEVL